MEDDEEIEKYQVGIFVKLCSRNIFDKDSYGYQVKCPIPETERAKGKNLQ